MKGGIDRLWGSVGAQFASITAANVVAAVLSFASLAVLARTLATAEFARVVFAQATMQTLFIVLDPRVDDSVVRYTPFVERQVGRGAATSLFRRSLLLDYAVGYAAGAVVAAVIASGVVPLGATGDRTFFALAAAQLGSQAALGTASSGFQITQGLARWGPIQIVLSLVITAFALVGLFVGGATGFLALSAVGAATTTAAASLLALTRVRKRFGPAHRVRLRKLPDFVRFTVKASLATSLAVGVDYVPVMILGFLGRTRLVADYRVAQAPGRLTLIAFSPAPAILYPLLSADAAEGRLDRIRTRVFRWSGALFLLAVPAAAVAWFVVPFFVETLFGGKFHGARLAASLLTLAALVRGTVAWSKVFPLALGKAGLRLAVVAVECTLFAVSTWLFAGHGLNAVAGSHLGVAAIVVALYVAIALVLTRSAPSVSTRASPFLRRWRHARE